MDFWTIDQLDNDAAREEMNNIVSMLYGKSYNIKKMGENELLSIFPEAKQIIDYLIIEYEDELELLNKKLTNGITLVYKIYQDEETCDFYTNIMYVSFKNKIEWYEKQIKRLKRLQSVNKRKNDPSAINDDDIQKAKEYPIEDLYDDSLRKSGNKLFGRCPFHREKDASFFIYTHTNSFHCFGCGISGDSIKYVMLKNELDFINAVKFLIRL